MDPNQQCSLPSSSNRDRARDIEVGGDFKISYHKRIPDAAPKGEYDPVRLSPGYRFHPTDDELIVDFLNMEINQEAPPYITISKTNIYRHNPEELTGMHQSEGTDWYFFSPRDRKYMNGDRPNRAAGNGYWKATGADQKIFRNGKCVGSKKCLVFYVGKPPKGDKTDWMMHEFVSEMPRGRLPKGAADMRLDNCVLCRIYKKEEDWTDTEEQTAPRESPKKRKKRARRRSASERTEHRSTNQNSNPPMQQQSLSVQQPSHPMQQQTPSGQHLNFPMPRQKFQVQESKLPKRQQNLQVRKQKLPMSEQSQLATQCSMQAGSHSLGEQLAFHRESYLSRPQQNMQAGSHSFDWPLNCHLESNSEEANMLLQNPQAIQDSLGGGWLDLHQGSIQEVEPIMLQPNLPTPRQKFQVQESKLPKLQQNLQVRKQMLPMLEQSQLATQCSMQAGSHSLGEQLATHRESYLSRQQQNMQAGSHSFDWRLNCHLERNSEEANTLLHNLQAIQDSLGGGRLDLHQGSIQEEVEPIMLQPNLPTPHQNLREMQSSIQAGSHGIGGQLDHRLENMPEASTSNHIGYAGDSQKSCSEFFSFDDGEFLNFIHECETSLGMNEYFPSSMDSLLLNPLSLDNNGHPQDATDIGDGLISGNTAASDNIYNHREQSAASDNIYNHREQS